MLLLLDLSWGRSAGTVDARIVTNIMIMDSLYKDGSTGVPLLRGRD